MLTGIIHPQANRTHNRHRDEIHKVQPEPFGEYKALRDAALVMRSSVGVVRQVSVVVRAIAGKIVGSGSGRDLASATEHCALRVGCCEERGGRVLKYYTTSQYSQPQKGSELDCVEGMISFDHGVEG